MPSDDEWYQAVAAIRENYGEDVFPPARRLISVGCASAYLARSVCDQIVRLAEEFNRQQFDGSGEGDG